MLTPEVLLPRLNQALPLGRAKAGITFAGVIFLHESLASDSTLFHELVHAVQWRALGADDFLLSYAVCTLLHGYAHNPFEAMAYDLQSQFDREEPIGDIVDVIKSQAGQTRAMVADIFRENRVVMGGLGS